MFSWLKRQKKEDQEITKLMEAFGRGHRAALAHEALASLGVKQKHGRSEELHVGYSANAVLREIKVRSSEGNALGDQEIVDFLFLSVFSDHLSRLLQCDARKSLLSAEMAYKPIEKAADEVGLIIEIHNAHGKRKSVVQQAIGDTFSRWINAPEEKHLDDLARLYEMTTEASKE